MSKRLSLAEEMFGLDLASTIKDPLQRGKVTVKGHWRKITHPRTGKVMKVWIEQGTRHQMLRHWRSLTPEQQKRLEESRVHWSKRIHGRPDALVHGNENEFFVARDLSIPRSKDARAEQMQLAQEVLRDFEIELPADYEAWADMKKFLAALASDKVGGPAFDLKDPDLRPGGARRAEFKRQVNPTRIEQVAPFLVKAHNAYAGAMEELSKVGHKIVVPYRVDVHKDPPDGLTRVDCPKGVGDKKRGCVEIDMGERAHFWASFYPDARHEIAQIAEEYDLDPGLVADIMAIMSAQTKWTGPGQDDPMGNQATAKQVVDFLVQQKVFTKDDIKGKVTGEQIAKAIRAYGDKGEGGVDFRAAGKTGLGTASERKTTNFALALFGDLDAFVADRHMANLAFSEAYAEAKVGGPIEYDAMEIAARRIARSTGMEVNTVQAVLWGYQRELGGVHEEEQKIADYGAIREGIKKAVPEIAVRLQPSEPGQRAPANQAAQSLAKSLRKAQLRRLSPATIKKAGGYRQATPKMIADALEKLHLAIPDGHPFWDLPPIPDGDTTTDWAWSTEHQEWVQLPDVPTGPKPGLTRRQLKAIGLTEEAESFAGQVLGRYYDDAADILDMRNAMIDLFKGIGIAHKIEQKGLSLAERMFGAP